MKPSKETLKQEYLEKGIITCELGLLPTKRDPETCWRNNALSFAHKEKRDKYRGRMQDLWTFKETILCCIPCHQKIEYNRELTLEVFKRLR